MVNGDSPYRRNGIYTVQTIFSIALQQPYTYPLQETLCIFYFLQKKLNLYDL